MGRRRGVKGCGEGCGALGWRARPRVPRGPRADEGVHGSSVGDDVRPRERDDGGAVGEAGEAHGDEDPAALAPRVYRGEEVRGTTLPRLWMAPARRTSGRVAEESWTVHETPASSRVTRQRARARTRTRPARTGYSTSASERAARRRVGSGARSYMKPQCTARPRTFKSRGRGGARGESRRRGAWLRRSDHRTLRHRARGARETPAHGPNVDGGGRRWKWQASETPPPRDAPASTRRSTPRGAKLLSSTVRRARRDISARREEVRRRAGGLLSTTRRHKRLSSTDALTTSPAPSSSSSPPSP